jgi:tyrosine-protein phosphatase SIW14
MKFQAPVLAIVSMIAAVSSPARAGELRGVLNFYELNPSVSRGAQPTDEGFQTLAKRGVKTVIDLRRPNEHSTEAERKVVESLGMRYVNVPMEGVVSPSNAQVSQILTLMNDQSAGPVFVHCKRGADRTGGVIACYRMQHDRWDNDKALKEAKKNGMAWTQFGIKAYVMSYRAAPSVAAPTIEAVAADAPK